ncbi:conserved Plasmodium protein, unknown function [Plasmodium gallinaceum]|uniref:Uncharacterized protein n=1 Tax=Plasmodium gallinaceum TaxID=5849 RepID=A0A1J1GYI2_PLAGA|nr:conserved Plasmodium protein, unknown function [Plasmodium gallinaceum]CRG97620.1 conserved Plasmodium protein, unknown function [Plasmodium gallinaceum]
MKEKLEKIDKYHKKYVSSCKYKKSSDEKNGKDKLKYKEEKKKIYNNYLSKEIIRKSCESSEETNSSYHSRNRIKKKYKEDKQEKMNSKRDDISNSNSVKNCNYDKYIHNKYLENKKYIPNEINLKKEKIKEDISNIPFNKHEKKTSDTFNELKYDKNENNYIKKKKRKLSPNSRKEDYISNEKLKKKENLKRRKKNYDRKSSKNKYLSLSSSDEKSFSSKYSSSENSNNSSSINESSSSSNSPIEKSKSKSSSYKNSSSSSSSNSSNENSSHSYSLDENSLRNNSSSECNSSSYSSYGSNNFSDKESICSSSSEENNSKKKKKNNAQIKKKKKKKEKEKEIRNKLDKEVVYDAHIYDSKEMIRLTINILQNYNFLNNLKILYQKLDKKKKISLENVKDLKLKKKLRHLFRAWRLEKKEEFYRKPSNFRESILDIFNSLFYFFLSKIDIQKLRKNINKRKNNLIKKESKENPDIMNDNNALSDYSTNNENINYKNQFLNDLQEDYSYLMQNANDKVISLREMHEEGYFKNSQQKYKEFLEKHKKIDLWGKNEQEQKFLLNSKSKPNERKTFDRETDLCINKFIKKEDYKNLIKNTKEHVNDKFHKTGNKI